MKKIICVFLFLLLIYSVGYNENRIPIKTKYDWKEHERRIDSIFEKYKKEVIDIEINKVSKILNEEKAKIYIEYFKKGLDSNTGLIMIEGGENSWLETAYYSGYRTKELFRTGYREGLIKSAEKTDK